MGSGQVPSEVQHSRCRPVYSRRQGLASCSKKLLRRLATKANLKRLSLFQQMI